MTTVENADVPLTAEGTRFCPGSQGGAEWNGAAYDAQHDIILGPASRLRWRQA